MGVSEGLGPGECSPVEDIPLKSNSCRSSPRQARGRLASCQALTWGMK